MFRKLFGASLLFALSYAEETTPTESTIVDDVKDTTTFCLAPYSNDVASGALWDLSALDKDWTATAGKSVFTWDYCEPVQGDYYFSEKKTNGDSTDVIGWASTMAGGMTAVKNEEGSTTGVTFTYTSDDLCKEEGETKINMAWTTTVECVADADLTLKGEPVVSADGCTVTTTYTGDAGCPLLDISETVSWF